MKRLYSLLTSITFSLLGQVQVDSVWLPYLPDRDAGYTAFFTPELNKLYIAGDTGRLGGFYVVECSTYQLITQVHNNFYRHGNYLWVWRYQKLYFQCNAVRGQPLTILNAVADTIERVFSDCKGLEYNSLNDEVYTVAGGKVEVRNPSDGSLIREILPHNSDWRLIGMPTWDSVYNRLFVTSVHPTRGWHISVYDCTNDSFLALIYLGGNLPPPRLFFNYRYDKGYFVAYSDLNGPAHAGVIDIKNYRLIKLFHFQAVDLYNLHPIAVDTIDNKVYIMCNPAEATDTLFVIDCANDSVIKKIPFGNSSCPFIRWIPWKNWIVFGGVVNLTPRTFILECRSDSIIAQLISGLWDPTVALLDPIRERVFLIDIHPQKLYILSNRAPGVMESSNKLSILQVPSLVQGVLVLPQGIGNRQFFTLFDITGRKVVDLKPGLNDVRLLAPGVYFVHSPDRFGTRRVMVVK